MALILGLVVGVRAAAAGPDVRVTASPATQSTQPGGAVRYRIAVRRSGGFRGRLALVARGLPRGAAGTWALRGGRRLERAYARGRTAVVPPNARLLTLTVRTSARTTAQSARVRIAAYGRGVRDSIAVTLAVRPAVEPPRAGDADMPVAGQPFEISGDAVTPLSPGASSPLDLRLTNPHEFPIHLTTLEVVLRDRTSKPGCSAHANYVAIPFRGRLPLRLPPGTIHLRDHVAAPSELPRVTMRDLPVNQDACRGATVHLDYSGTATR